LTRKKTDWLIVIHRTNAVSSNIEDNYSSNLDHEDKTIFDENDAADELQRALEKTVSMKFVFFMRTEKCVLCFFQFIKTLKLEKSLFLF